MTGIIDTGASASLLPGSGTLMKNWAGLRYGTNALAKTASNQELAFREYAILESKPLSGSYSPVMIEYYILPGHENILNQQAIFGLNIIKSFNINTVMKEGQLVAEINGIPIRNSINLGVENISSLDVGLSIERTLLLRS